MTKIGCKHCGNQLYYGLLCFKHYKVWQSMKKQHKADKKFHVRYKPSLVVYGGYRT